MIFPSRQLLSGIILPGLAVSVIYSLLPQTHSVILYSIAVLVVLFSYDAFRCLFNAKTIQIETPDTLRMYRGIAAEIPLQLNSATHLSGCILDIVTNRYHILQESKFTIRSAELQEKCAITLLPLERGLINSLDLHIKTASPFGFWFSIQKKKKPMHCSVFANNKLAHALLDTLHAEELSGDHLRALVGKGQEVDCLRDYVSGDSMSDIHWKAMARHGYPITKEYRIERCQSLYIVIDTSCFSKRIIDYQETSVDSLKLPVPLIERSIVAADTLMMIAARQGDRTGLVTFDDKIHTFIKPDAGTHHLILCRKSLIDIQAGISPSDYRECFQYLAGNIHRRSMILIIADLDDPYTSESFASNVSLLTKRHVVCGVCPVSPSIQPLFSSAVDSCDSIYSALSGHLKWQASRKLQQSVWHLGGEIILSPYEHLASSAINAYIRMKRNQSL